jgi:hypothetical protein
MDVGGEVLGCVQEGPTECTDGVVRGVRVATGSRQPDEAIVIPEGAGPGNPQFLFLIFLLVVLRLLVGSAG